MLFILDTPAFSFLGVFPTEHTSLFPTTATGIFHLYIYIYICVCVCVYRIHLTFPHWSHYESIGAFQKDPLAFLPSKATNIFPPDFPVRTKVIFPLRSTNFVASIRRHESGEPHGKQTTSHQRSFPARGSSKQRHILLVR